MAVICNVLHTTRGFTYDKKIKALVSEASTITAGDKHALFGRVYDDACDEGFVLKSHVTGGEIVFAIDKIDLNSDGEVMCWYLVPIRKATGRQDPSRDFHVLVIND
jgi:hypothetical protein